MDPKNYLTNFLIFLTVPIVEAEKIGKRRLMTEGNVRKYLTIKI